jgi:hypothetical protein
MRSCPIGKLSWHAEYSANSGQQGIGADAVQCQTESTLQAKRPAKQLRAETHKQTQQTAIHQKLGHYATVNSKRDFFNRQTHHAAALHGLKMDNFQFLLNIINREYRLDRVGTV